MADLVENAEGGFWRASVAQEAAPLLGTNSSLAEVCQRCASEFILGARFCHACGAARPGLSAPRTDSIWTRGLVYARQLEFQRVKERLSLPTSSLIAFLFGMTCVLAAVAVSFIFSANTVLDWQAIQVWRIEWLLGAVAMFLAAILLKRA